MHLAVISPPSFDPREPSLVDAMVAEGLDRYHVRKPGFTLERLRTWLGGFSEQVRRVLVLHQHHALVEEMGLLGRHWKDDKGAPADPSKDCYSSRSCHDLVTLLGSLDVYDAVLVAPVFESISKPGHGPRMGTDWMAWMRVQPGLGARRVPGRTVIYALGGVDETRVANCREAGFGGVAVLGAVWGASEPLEAFVRLHEATEREISNR